jgi:hypothetical protein
LGAHALVCVCMPRLRFKTSIYIYKCIYTHTHTYIHTYTNISVYINIIYPIYMYTCIYYIYRKREKDSCKTSKGKATYSRLFEAIFLVYD